MSNIKKFKFAVPTELAEHFNSPVDLYDDCGNVVGLVSNNGDAEVDLDKCNEVLKLRILEIMPNHFAELIRRRANKSFAFTHIENLEL